MTKSDKISTGQPAGGPARAVSYPMGASFLPALTDAEAGAFSVLALAHIGDGVYELMMRTALAASGVTAAHTLHRETVRRVNAPAQAMAVQRLLPLLTDAELAVYKRGRNAKVNSVPQHANVAEYHAATGLEALFGWLWLRGEAQRLETLFNTVHGEGMI